MTHSDDNAPTTLSADQHRLLRLLKSGKARLVRSEGGFRLAGPLAGETVPQPLVRELLRLRLLEQDGEGGFRVSTAADRQKPGFDEAESPLYRLRFRKDGKAAPYLSAPQYAAGEKLRADFERAELSPRVTANWSGERVDRNTLAGMSDNRMANIADAALDARARVHAAFDAVGPELAAVLYYVCCLAGGLEQAERFLSLPPRSGKAILSLALTRLARHYRLLRGPQPIGSAAHIGHWALADYRPVIASPPAHQP